MRSTKNAGWVLLGAVLGGLLTGVPGPTALAEQHEAKRAVRRVGMVIGLKPESADEYEALHADDRPGVRDLLTRANMKNFSIFVRELDDGRPYLFGYYEYVGPDFEADMKWLSEQPRNHEWLAVTDAMQAPLKGQSGWATMREVYHND